MYNILNATSQDTSLFFPLRSFLLPAPTALLRPVADLGLVKSSNKVPCEQRNNFAFYGKREHDDQFFSFSLRWGNLPGFKRFRHRC